MRWLQSGIYQHIVDGGIDELFISYDVADPKGFVFREEKPPPLECTRSLISQSRRRLPARSRRCLPLPSPRLLRSLREPRAEQGGGSRRRGFVSSANEMKGRVCTRLGGPSV